VGFLEVPWVDPGRSILSGVNHPVLVFSDSRNGSGAPWVRGPRMLSPRHRCDLRHGHGLVESSFHSAEDVVHGSTYDGEAVVLESHHSFLRY
jgi:hypothetical protein